MHKLLLKNVLVAGGPEDLVTVSIEGETISGVLAPSESGNGESIDGGGAVIFPGFADVHIHGSVGIDVNAADAGGLLEIAEFLARSGVTSWLPTLVPDSDDVYRRVIGEIDRLMEMQAGRPVAQAVGVHYEGVFANEMKCGALRPEFFKKFTGKEVLELPVPRRGARMTTYAPEIDGGIELTRELVRHGWIASIGHTRADVATLDAAFNAGARHLTHFFNAMSGIHHRDVGVAGWALANGDVTFDIIADGIHVSPQMLRLACGVKTPEKVTLISDAVAPTGLGDGEFEIWGERVSVVDGRTQNERGSIAGSVITMNDAVRRMLSLGFSAEEAAQMAAGNPARLLGLDKAFGTVEPGLRADLTALDSEGNLKFVMIGGRLVDR